MSGAAALDRSRLELALQLAHHSIGLSDPNPRVGCVIGREDGNILGRGFTQAAGDAHAEVMALRDAAGASVALAGVTAWVTLEPCAHQGRTPPCCDALIRAGIGRVVIAALDPNPAVCGRGVERLRSAGIEVAFGPDDLAIQTLELNIGFFSRMIRNRPWVRMKIAMTIDGKTALPSGESRWITGIEARTNVHEWRKRSGAVMTGIGTVIADDPELNVRLIETTRQPIPVILDSNWRVPLDSRVLQRQRHCLVFGVAADSFERLEALRAYAEVILTPAAQDGVNLGFVLSELNAREINELLIEAGPNINGSMLDQDLIDEMLVYVSPQVFGEGHGLARLAAPRSIAAAWQGRFIGSSACGKDLLLRIRRTELMSLDQKRRLA